MPYADRVGAAPSPIARILKREAVLPSVRARNRDQLLQAIATCARSVYGLDADDVSAGLRSRERFGSTAMGRGVAIPHIRLPQLDSALGLLARADRPVDFAAPDGQGVDIIFAIFSPQEQSGVHLLTLARVARLLRETDLCAKLRATAEAQSLYALVTEPIVAGAA
jgi:PTS system nitrogen regulatory IIA component